MSDLNKVILFGHITKNAEKKVIAGNTLVSFSIAVNHHVKTSEGKVTNRPDFFYIKLWNKYGESLFPYLVKGQAITVIARLRQWRWLDRDTQLRHSRLELQIKEVGFAGPRPKSAGPVVPAPAGENAGSVQPAGTETSESLAADALGDDDDSIVDEIGIPVAENDLPESEDLRN